MGCPRPDSDWDLAVIGPDLKALDLHETAAELASILEADVDLVDLTQASSVLKAEVLRHGRRVLELDPLRIACFEMHALTEYQNLNESRKPILRDHGMAA